MYSRIIILSLFTAFSIPILVSDCKTQSFPRIFVQVGIFILVAGHLICFLHTKMFNILSFIQYFAPYIVSTFSSFLLLVLTKKVSKNGLGNGDILYGAMCSLALEFPKIPIGYIFSCLYAFIAFLFKWKAKSKDKTAKLAFTPFMFAGSLSAQVALQFLDGTIISYC